MHDRRCADAHLVPERRDVRTRAGPAASFAGQVPLQHAPGPVAGKDRRLDAAPGPAGWKFLPPAAGFSAPRFAWRRRTPVLSIVSALVWRLPSRWVLTKGGIHDHEYGRRLC